MSNTVAVLINADQGIGAKLTKCLTRRFNGDFYFTAPDEIKGRNAVNELNKLGFALKYHQLDISDAQSIILFRNHIQQNYDGISLLINNIAVSKSVPELLPVNYENAKLVLKNYYYDYLVVQELLYPLLQNHSRVVFVTKQCDFRCLKHEYWQERLSKHLDENEINEFLQSYLISIKNGSCDNEVFITDPYAAPFRVANIGIHMLVSLQKKKLRSRSISVELLFPSIIFLE